MSSVFLPTILLEAGRAAMYKTRQLQLGDNSDQGQQIAWEDELLSSPSWDRKTSTRPVGKMSDLPMIFIVGLSEPLSVWADLSFQERRCPYLPQKKVKRIGDSQHCAVEFACSHGNPSE